MSRTSDTAYATGKGMARQIELTPEALAVLRAVDKANDAEAARKREQLLAEVREVLVGRVFKP